MKIGRACLWVVAEVLMLPHALKTSMYKRSSGFQICGQGCFCILKSWGLQIFRACAFQAEEFAGTRGLGRRKIRAVRLLLWKPVFLGKKCFFCCCSPQTDMPLHKGGLLLFWIAVVLSAASCPRMSRASFFLLLSSLDPCPHLVLSKMLILILQHVWVFCYLLAECNRLPFSRLKKKMKLLWKKCNGTSPDWNGPWTQLMA